MAIPAPLRPGPWLVEHTLIALMIGGLLLALLIVGLGLT